MSQSFTLTITCPDRPGIVQRVSGMILDNGGNILDSSQFGDCETGMFFMRVVFETNAAESDLATALGASAAEIELDWKLAPSDRRARVLLLVSKFDHCLGDLLYRSRTGDLAMDVVGVVCNHPKEVLNITILGDVPFHYLPVTPATKPAQEAAIRTLIEESGADLIVLARYMQILSDEMAGFLSGRCINIHHSFLPSFKGAKPYHQAHARGVKMIGATAHYVTGDLDEGPIIHQDAEAITHADSPDDLVRLGRDVERRVLARAVRYHLQHRVLLNGRKTVVFAGRF
jgi:formyltetrahydrofolate deformylase